MTNAEKSTLIGNRLRLAREQAGLSQGQVAKMVNLHRPSISEIEAGRRKVSAEELAEFARIYGVSMDWLAGVDEQVVDMNRDRLQLAARKLANIRPEDLDKLIDLLSSLRED